MKNLKSQRGFTLIELMVCVAIIGIVASLIASLFLVSANFYVSEAGALACVKAKYPDAIKSVNLERGVVSYARSTIEYQNGDQQDFLLDVNILGNCSVVEEFVLVRRARSVGEAPKVEEAPAAPPSTTDPVDGGRAENAAEVGPKPTIEAKFDPDSGAMVFTRIIASK